MLGERIGHCGAAPFISLIECHPFPDERQCREQGHFESGQSCKDFVNGEEETILTGIKGGQMVQILGAVPVSAHPRINLRCVAAIYRAPATVTTPPVGPVITRVNLGLALRNFLHSDCANHRIGGDRLGW